MGPRKAPSFNMSNITYCGIHFNEEWIREQTEEEFVDAPENRQHWKQSGFTISDKARKERLRELHRLITKNKDHENIKQPDLGGGKSEPEEYNPGKRGLSLANLEEREHEKLSDKSIKMSSDEKTERIDFSSEQREDQ